MIWILLGSLLFGSGTDVQFILFGWSHQTIERRIHAVVLDPPRRQQAQAILDDIDAFGEADLDAYADIVTTFGEVHRRHDAVVADYAPMFDQLDAERQQAWDQMVDSRLAMAEVLTREEWDAIFNPPDLDAPGSDTGHESP